MTLKQIYWDKETNTTHGLISTAEFTQWYSASGRLNTKDFLATVRPVVIRHMADLQVTA